MTRALQRSSRRAGRRQSKTATTGASNAWRVKANGAAIYLTIVSASILSSTQAHAGAAKAAVQIVPHRAVYDVSLDNATEVSGISSMTGRMVYELSGSRCDGYTQNMRFVTRITDKNGAAQTNDTRASSWEGGAAERLRFRLSQYRDDRLTDVTEGDAGRANGAKAPVAVKLQKPVEKVFQIDPKVYFPMQHSIALIEAAKAGKTQLTAKVYDGSDQGEKVYLTSAYIGNRLPADASLVTPEINKELAQQDLRAWPVSISFFEPGGEHTDAIPAYELSFRFIENGISTRFHIDYGEFAVRGTLRELSLLDQVSCDPPAKPNSQ